MSGYCSAHRHHDPDCFQCNIPVEPLLTPEQRIAVLEAEIVKVSRTYGELPESVQDLIESHEWDNMNISEQRDWAIGSLRIAMDRIAEMRMRNITPEATS